MAKLQADHCEAFSDLDTGPTCAKGYKDGLADASAAAGMRFIGQCVTQLDTCADVVACLGGLSQQGKLRGCTESGDDVIGAAVGRPRAEWMKLTGRNAKTYADVHSTKDQPVEVCGIATENEWLSSLTCTDGSHPIENRGAAEQFRVGDLGAGGRCSSIIDLYRVKCPEATYDVYLDGYVCPMPD